jgi:predicted glutamine amidotransferase
MCEMLAASFPEPVEFAFLADQVGELERLGLGGFGWGVAWLEQGGVATVRDTGRYLEQGIEDASLRAISSERFLVHLRRPSRLSTVSLADTQPFFDGARHAWCHNGFLARAEELRPRFADVLQGRADSEVGWAYFKERLAAGIEPTAALGEVADEFGGTVNLGYLGADGTTAVYSKSETNNMWRFRLGQAEVACTSLHSSDESLFDLIFPEATGRELLVPGSSLELAGPLPAAA